MKSLVWGALCVTSALFIYNNASAALTSFSDNEDHDWFTKKHNHGIRLILLFVLGAYSLSAHAALIGRLPTTEGGTDYQAYYDDTLDITWLADANLADTESFGVAVSHNGSMDWDTAGAWISAMNTSNGGSGYLGVNDWRLPTVSPIDGLSPYTLFTNNATSDRGFAGPNGWVDVFGAPASEMGHMYYVTLGNLGYCTPDDDDPEGCVQQAGWGLVNEGPFTNLVGNLYWSGTHLNAERAWYFHFGEGDQATENKGVGNYVWAVRSGDISIVPIPATMWLFGSALGMLSCWMRRKR